MAKKRYDYFADSSPSQDDIPEIVDCNGTVLSQWDTLIAVKWLPVKWGTDIKKWEKFTNISLWSDGLVWAKHKKNGKMFLKSEYFKKS